MGVLARCNRPKSELIKGVQIVVARDAGFGTGNDRSVHRAGKAFLGASLGDRDRFEPWICHAQILSRPYATTSEKVAYAA